jgi:dipeptidyl aminopeptidase/acylaminoacyl peptidase
MSWQPSANSFRILLVFLVARETALVFPGAGSVAAEWALPADPTLDWDSTRVLADDGVPVFLLTAPHPDAGPETPWAIYFHGNGGLVGTPGSIGRYRLLHEAGFSVLAVEFRGYGVSAHAGKPSESGLYADARAAWDHLTTDLGVDPGRIVIYGWSLGSGPATYLADEFDAAALITEGAPTSAPDRAAELYPWVPVRLLMRTRFDNLARARTLQLPWLLFHGRNDVVIPFHHGVALAEADRDAELVPLVAGHNDGVLAERERALEALRGLVGRIGW